MRGNVKGTIVLLAMLLIATIAGAATGENPRLFDWKKAYFFNFYGVCPLADGNVWVVGSKGMICAFDPKSRQWVVQESGFARNLYDVGFTDSKNGWVVGQNGLILHTENGGTAWSNQNSGSNEHLFSLSFPTPNDGWAVGAYGTILHTENGGKKWELQGEQVDRIYNDVCFVDSNTGWVVGEFGVILHTSDGGKTWVQQENPLGEKTLFIVSFETPTNGVLGGMDGMILHTTDGGSTWSPIESKTKENLFCVTAKRGGQWAVGLKGTYTKHSGDSWRESNEKIPTRAWLKTCAFVDEKSGWIVGSVGTVLHTVDGGETWTPVGQIVGK